jgi:hypothetical protein
LFSACTDDEWWRKLCKACCRTKLQYRATADCSGLFVIVHKTPPTGSCALSSTAVFIEHAADAVHACI